VGNKTDLEENHRLPEQEIRAVSPASRMARFIELQKRAFALLAASPDGCRRFWQHNLQKRRIHSSF